MEHTHQVVVLAHLRKPLAALQGTVNNSIVARMLLVQRDVSDGHDNVAAVVRVLTLHHSAWALIEHVLLPSTRKTGKYTGIRNNRQLQVGPACQRDATGSAAVAVIPPEAHDTPAPRHSSFHTEWVGSRSSAIHAKTAKHCKG